MIRNSTGLLHFATAVALISAVSVAKAQSQTNLPPTGLMLGSTIDDRTRGRDRDRDRDRRDRPGAPWTGGVRFIPGYGGCDQPVIIVNNSPCYIPGYYAGINGYPGYGSYGYSTGGFSAGFQVGGLSLGYRQNNGYYNSGGYYGYSGYPQQGYVQPQLGYDAYVPDPAYVNGYTRAYDDRVRPNTIDERRAPAVVPSKPAEENDYYLHRKPSPAAKNPALAEALKDIETAFRTGNAAPLEKHIDRAGKLTLQVKGTTRQEMSAEDYLAMTRDALKVMKTSRYELTKVEPASNGAVMVTGTHVLRTEDGQQKSFTVGFILKQRGESWLITEVSAEPAK